MIKTHIYHVLHQKLYNQKAKFEGEKTNNIETLIESVICLL